MLTKRLAALSCAVLLGLAGGGCGDARPKPICVMQNPKTGQRVQMFKEIWFKVPPNYDEKKHIEQWQAEQRKNGFTMEVKS